MRSFSVSNAMCANEADRVLVCSNVSQFMKDISHLLPKAPVSDDDALILFDKLVQEKVPRMLIASIGNVGVPYKYVLLIFVPTALSRCDRWSVMRASVSSGLEEISFVLYGCLLYFALIPLNFALVSWLSKRLLHLKGSLEWFFLAAIVVALLVSYVLQVVLLYTLFMDGERYFQSEALFVIQSITAALFSALTFAVYRPLHVRKEVSDAKPEAGL
eukprot:gnl/TRDRNA2_/TRDRNA2_131899_c0_seq1.p1 gnl/TRDRNA2_/TRDRNA2_131899_c0~~gnl/TRDRNA2_/TRDRNA2_131899_c0_seq1.p1  ORF type:complete len:216 (-),score=25.22 gnl/TRDRNA2_/TRDRNA2_131899_c0_seq1:124-771(-)